ncbi:phage tail tape measure protein [Candidatus Sororendozoicomonas aggregata]|uniref:phage tail tape measure protein n=1 Tax=Candidatus Sororendozoicomonas aggregata TaxID=3073239 RepID=UPI002ED09EDF
MADTRLSLIIEAVDKVTAPLRKVASTTDKFSNSLKQQQNQLSKLNGHKKNIDALGALNKKLGSTAAELDQARRKTSRLGKALASADKPTKKLQKEFERSQRVTKRLAATHNNLRQEARSMRSQLRDAGTDTRKLGQASNEAASKIKRLEQSMAAAKQKAQALNQATRIYERGIQRAANISFISEATARVGQSFTRVLQEPLRQAISFESAMADVRKVVNFESPEQLKAFGDHLKEMSKTIPIAKEGLAEIAAAGGQLGVEQASLPAFVETVAKMSTAFDMLPEEAGDAMAKLANVYQIPIDQVEKLGDVINHLSDNTAAKARDIVPALQRIGGTAKTFGLSAREATALVDAFIALGKPPEVAATAINALLIKLQTAEKQGSKFQDALAELGYSASDLTAAIGDDAQGSLNEFLETLASLDNQSRAGVLANLFGTEYADDISLLTGSIEQYQKAVQLLGDETDFVGSMQREFENRSNTTGNRLKLMDQRWRDLQDRIGQALLPVLEKLIPKIESFIDSLNKFVETSPSLTTGIVGLIGGIGVIALIAAPVITAIAALTGAIAMMGLSARKAKINMGGGFSGGSFGDDENPKKKGRGRRLARGLGIVGTGIGALSIGSTLMDDKMTAGQKAADISATVGGIGGAIAGAKLGAILGSVVPGLGTVVGGIAGSIAGGIGGDWLGSTLGSLFSDSEDKPESPEKASSVKAAAAVTAALVAAPAVAMPAPITQQQTTIERVQIHQQPGEDAEALAEKVMEKINDQQRYRQQGVQHDE